MKIPFIILLLFLMSSLKAQTSFKHSIYVEAIGSNFSYSVGYENRIALKERLCLSNSIGLSQLYSVSNFNYETGILFGRIQNTQFNAGMGASYGISLIRKYERFERRQFYPHIYFGIEWLGLKDRLTINLNLYGGCYFYQKPNDYPEPEYIVDNYWFPSAGLKIKYNFGKVD